MEKKYQVFISSTYSDLKEERSKIFQTLMELDCIPAGMELFPATDEEQFEFIKRIIDDCDYYLLVIGGRYGSTTAQGISYTEKEYDYAIEKGIKVVALLHEKPNEIPYEKSEQNEISRKLLESFREKAATGRLVRFWKTAEDIPGIVALSMAKTIKMFPATGWIRADLAENRESSKELARLSIENHELREKLKHLKEETQKTESNSEIKKILQTSEKEVHVYYKDSEKWEAQKNTTLFMIFSLIAPDLIQEKSSNDINSSLAFHLKDDTERKIRSNWPLPTNTITGWLADLAALNLVEPSNRKHAVSDKNEYWQLTSFAKEFLKDMRLNQLKEETKDVKS